jgi:hypothetical protein
MLCLRSVVVKGGHAGTSPRAIRRFGEHEVTLLLDHA